MAAKFEMINWAKLVLFLRKNSQTLVGCTVGFLIMIEIPDVMNGTVKSTTFRRAEVMVKSANAKSASYEQMVVKDGHKFDD